MLPGQIIEYVQRRKIYLKGEIYNMRVKIIIIMRIEFNQQNSYICNLELI